MRNKQKIQSAIKDGRLRASEARNVSSEISKFHLKKLHLLIDQHFSNIRPSEIQGHSNVLMHKAMMPSQEYANEHLAEVFFTLHETNQFVTELYELWQIAKSHNRELRKEVANG